MNEPEQPSKSDIVSSRTRGYGDEIELSDEAMRDLIDILDSGEDINKILDILQPTQWEIDRFRLLLHQLWSGPQANQFLAEAELWVRRSKQEGTIPEFRSQADSAHAAHASLKKAHLNIGVIGPDWAGKTTLTSALTKFFGEFQPYDEIAQAPKQSTDGITLSIVQVEYQSPSRRYTHFDFPEHSDTVKAMIVGAARLDGAILVISADEGPTPQAREHILLARQVGVKTIVVFLNKTDRVQDPELIELIELEIRELVQKYGYPDDLPVVKGSALEALIDPGLSERAIRELVDCLDTAIPLPERNDDAPFLMQVDDVRSEAARLGVLVKGYIERGRIRVGDTVEIIGQMPATRATCAAIEISDTRVVEASSGDTIELELAKTDVSAIQRGQVLCQPGSVVLHNKFQAEVYFLTAMEGGRVTPFFPQYRPQFHLPGTDTHGRIDLPEGTELVMPGDTVVINVELVTPATIEEQTRFYIREGSKIIGTGVITAIED